MKKRNDLPADYYQTIEEIKNKVRQAQQNAFRAVNNELIGVYWEIGRIIVNRQERDAKWGDAVVECMAEDLQSDLNSTIGFSRRNLFNMRKFYLEYRDNKKVQALTAQINWTSNVVILQNCKDPLEREFYLRMAGRYGSEVPPTFRRADLKAA